ncbi:MAG: cytochrome C oxidase subunit IV family protein [Anaerolineae bacterium]|nr:cytochrome C oxidase subunit IV family protein [Anaerolineae bacterium]MDK1117545.1 cytochrome C oxidase subunit IV family protein [Anaerolineae bacterium]
MNKPSDKKVRMRIGWITFIALGVLTIVEYFISLYIRPSTPYLIVTAVIKGWLIISYFMHIAQVWRRDKDSK